MLGSVSCNRKNTSINLRSIYNNFISSLNNGLLPHLPKNEELKDLTNADGIVDYLYNCWLVPELSYHVALYCKSLCKVFVLRGKEDKTKRVQYIHALGKTAAHTNISVDCYNYIASKSEILKERITKSETVTLLLGLSSIVKNVPECKGLIRKEDVLKYCKSTDSDVKRHAEHLLARCSDLNDDVFNNSTPVDYPGDCWQDEGCVEIDMDDSEPVYLERVEDPLFCTGNKVLHIKHKQGTEKAIVRTSNVDEALSQVGEAYDARKPVLLQGEIGSGKTLVLEHFASMFGLSQEEVLSVQLDEQTDSKILIGNYVCSEVPGQYVWQPGVLTRAATTGKWIIFEDIDHAPSDVMSLIKSVTETHRILTPAASLTTHPNFTVFLTQRVTEAGFGYHHNPVLAMLDNTFCKVRLKFYNDTQLEQVISGKFQALSGCARRLVELYNSLSNSTLRQLIKWSSRVQGHLTHNLTVVTKEVFLEAVDCFCSWQACPVKRDETAYKIGTFLSMPKSKVESYLKSYQPVITPSNTHYTVGRCTLQCHTPPHTAPLYAHTRSAAVLLEKLACAVQHREPVLLTGETGNGKTASVQHLAARTGNNLVVINMSQQSDAADLIGGFKPLDVIQLIKPLYTTFELLFKESFSVSKNANFLYKVQVCWRQKEWSTLLQAILHISNKMSSKRWRTLGEEANKINKQIEQIENSFAFSFIEGSLVQAVKKGDWVLLDEINLAPLEVLESLNCILDDTGFLVVESGNMDVVKKHPNFRLFAAMNPSTDVGKKDLPVGIKNRFTEIYVDELTEETDLKTLTAAYLHHLNLPSAIINKIVALYTELRRQAADVLTDGRGHKPCYSIRTLCRALKYIECSFRLIDQYKRTVTGSNQQGLLLYNGGTVCDDGFSTYPAYTVCKQLGFQSASAWDNRNLWYSLQTSYYIRLRIYSCPSSYAWSSCSYTGSTNPSGCSHSEDIYLTCTGGCTPGQYLNSGSCTSCPNNTYSTTTGIQSSCTACPGESVSREGSNQCVQCPQSSTAVEGETRCTCGDGHVWEWASSTSASCVQCPEDTYKAEGMLECQSCPEHSNSTAGSEYCACISGMYRNNTSCHLCPETSASPAGALNCTECPSGSTALNNGTSCSCPAGQIWTWDEEKVGSCQPCPENTWKDENMLICTACPEFSRSESGSARCTCSGGKIWGNSSCLNCIPGTYKSELMSSCSQCSATSVSQDGALGCLQCPPGSLAMSNNTVCMCPSGMGWAWSNKTLGSCNICPENTFQSSVTSTCLPCPLFSTSTAGSTTCSCAAGTFKNSHGTCSVCPSGTSSGAGSDHCLCPAGTFWNRTSCHNCGGSSASRAGALQCSPCPEGYSFLSGGTECLCPSGSVWTWDNGNNGQCVSCVPGTYKDRDAGTCLDCERGYVSTDGAEICQRCPPGTVPDRAKSSCSCLDGGLWIWSNHGNGSCVSIKTSKASPHQHLTVIFLACITATLVAGFLLFSVHMCKKWKVRKGSREEVRVHCAPEGGTVHIEDPERGQQGGRLKGKVGEEEGVAEDEAGVEAEGEEGRERVEGKGQMEEEMCYSEEIDDEENIYDDMDH